MYNLIPRIGKSNSIFVYEQDGTVHEIEKQLFTGNNYQKTFNIEANNKLSSVL